jgi:hypothetical protein
MELYSLNANLQREEVYDVFDSLIWTERFQKEGDFELNVVSNTKNNTAFAAGTMLALNESKRVMVSETMEDSLTSDGEKSLKITGRSIEKCLYDRVARGTMGSLTAESKWKLTGTPGAIMRKIFHDICVTGILAPDVVGPPFVPSPDKIPFVVEGNLLPSGTIAETTTSLNLELEPMSVGDALSQLAEQYDLGYRLLRGDDTSQLWFDVYTGSDRTTGQSFLPAVIFSPDLGNLQDTKALTSNAIYKNVAYVFSPVGSKVVYPDGVDPAVSGFERRILIVTADDITDAATADEQMRLRGLAELAKNRQVSAFDGQITEFSDYKYGVDYQLGDLIEVRNTDGSTNKMRITEQIFVSDKEGDRSYPTLALNQFITPGSWLGWDSNQKWADLDASMATWADQP